MGQIKQWAESEVYRLKNLGYKPEEISTMLDVTLDFVLGLIG